MEIPTGPLSSMDKKFIIEKKKEERKVESVAKSNPTNNNFNNKEPGKGQNFDARI